MPFPSLPLRALERIDQICDTFEAAWHAGERPRIEAFLTVSDFEYHSALLHELLAREIELRRRAGEFPEAAEYEQRFAGHVELIRTVLAQPDPSEETSINEVPSTDGEPGADPGERTDHTVPATTGPGTEGGAKDQSACTVTVLPERIGPYQPLRLLGQGNFLVYLAVHEEDGREVAIKVAPADKPRSRRRLMSLGEEARRLAEVDHPGIVRLHDFVPPRKSDDAAEPDDGFIVLEYVAGSTLEDLLRGARIEPQELTRIMADVADALHHAHTVGLVHRDLKPSNILLNLRGQPRICDFGLAIDEEVQRLRQGEVAGTLPYMAPEQVCGETNRLDGRTDIWAIGVILYRGLTGRLPFRGQNTAECFEEILRCEPRPPRQYGNAIPRELERICLRCLSRQMSDRYLTAADLGEDLRRWLASATGEPARAVALPTAVSKGLRSYGGEDAAFFLSLLPGPRSSDGLPESVRFWKSRIESLQGDGCFSVGLVYGLSGGGKSSFVRAGLIPQLDRQRVRPLVLDASPGQTESRLLAELRRVAPLLPADCNLADAIALLRDDARLRPREKLLLVLDQFEQWLQSRPIEPDALLIRGLRQCDGRHVQVLLLVRDDFWMATTRLFRTIDIPLIEGKTAMAVELFDARHARKVLELFGRVQGQLPNVEITPGSDSDRFLAETVSGLAGPDGRIVPVRLCLFVEVVRHRPWTLQTLRSLGGMEGIGVKFLEETFDSPTAPPVNRLHRAAAEALLKLLLPAPGTVLRSVPRSGQALREAAGLGNRPRDFADLLQLLDHDLRLITPIGPQSCAEQGTPGEVDPSPSGDEPCYQLAHDYLIRPIRQWLKRHQRATREGRAHIRLEAVTWAWIEHPGGHRLPSLLEYAGIVLQTRRSSWNDQERRVMRAATRHFLGLAGVLALCLIITTLAGKRLSIWFEQKDLLNTALAAEDRQLPGIMLRLAPYQNEVIAPLEVRERQAGPEDHDRAVAGMLLFRFAPSASRGQYLRQLLLGSSEPDRVELICNCLATHRQLAGLEELRAVLASGDADPGRRLRAACAFAQLEPDRTAELDAAIPAIISTLLEERSRQIPGWLSLLGPIQARFIAPLGKICADPAVDPLSRTTAAEALCVILTRLHDTVGLAELVVNSQPDASTILLRELASRGASKPAIQYFENVLDRKIEELPAENSKDELAARAALAAIGLKTLGRPGAVSRLLSLGQPDPRVRAALIQRQAALDFDRVPLLEKLVQPDVNPTERQAILMICAETQHNSLSDALRSRLLTLALPLYHEDPDPGVHSAAELLLRRLHAEPLLAPSEPELRKRPDEKNPRRWFIGPEGHTFAVVSGPLVFPMGSPTSQDTPSQVEERLHFRKIDRSFALATKEVSLAQYRKFRPGAGPDNHFTHDLRCPANGVNWYDAAGYCNWLSKQEGIPQNQWCYPEPIKPGMTLPNDAVERTGYRLPTEAEWEYVCRAGTTTSRFFGSAEELLPRYGWTWLNSHDRAWPTGQLLPNALGMFDMLGNLWEWCHDGPEGNAKYAVPYPAGTTADHPLIDPMKNEVIAPLTYRTLRGGAFDYSPAQARAAHRYPVSSDYGEGTFGFRVARTLPRHTSH